MVLLSGISSETALNFICNSRQCKKGNLFQLIHLLSNRGIQFRSGTRQEFRFPSFSKVLTISATKFDGAPKEVGLPDIRQTFQPVVGEERGPRANHIL